MNEQAGAGMLTQGATPVQAMKRRGILAAAGVAIAGIAAQWAAQPVEANTDGQALIIAAANSEASGGTSLTYTGSTITSGAALLVTDGGAADLSTALVAGIATAGKADFGISGQGGNVAGVSGQGTNHDGVRGSSTLGFGVFGIISSAPANTGTAGVAGIGSGDGTYGVYGFCGDDGIGVLGVNQSAVGTGVKGQSASGFPVVGQITSGATTNAAVTGAGTAGPGVQGQSTGGYGLVGFTNATDGHAALIGYANAPGGIGLIGNAPGGVSPGLAGVFNGDVIVNGALRVYGGPKNAAVKHPTDNSYRLLYCMESTESWFEDFGDGTLAGDRADIRLDPDFAALVHTDKYHVFLTAHGPNHLYATQQTANGFTVVGKPWESGGGGLARPEVAAGTFSYRVVAKRNDITGDRLAKAPPPSGRAGRGSCSSASSDRMGTYARWTWLQRSAV